MRGASFVQQHPGGGDHARSDPFEVIGVHLHPHHIVLLVVHEHRGAHASQGFRQGRSGSTVQKSHGLMRPGIYRHGGREGARGAGNKGDAEVFHQGVLAQCIGKGELFVVEHAAKVALTDLCGAMSEEHKKRLLLVEDEETLRSTLRMNFELEGYDVTTAVRGSEALDRIHGAHFDGIVLDVMLPDVDGFTICETIRIEGDRTPVLFLTARTTPADRVRGLRTGDDYLGKPFDLRELLLRVEKLVSRSRTEAVPQASGLRTFGTNTVDFDRYEITGQRGLRKRLTQREVMLLRLLTERAGEVVSREEILQKVWGYDVFPTTRTIDNFIVSFRKYFEVNPQSPKHFMSIRGVGYLFVD